MDLAHQNVYFLGTLDFLYVFGKVDINSVRFLILKNEIATILFVVCDDVIWIVISKSEHDFCY